jgi:hypothetical protein
MKTLSGTTKALLLSVTLLLSVSGLRAQDKIDVLPSGTLVPISFTHIVCSNSNHQITAYVARDIYGDSGKVVIRGGEAVKINIERQKARGFGRSGWVQVTVTSVTAVDGTEIMLSGNDRVGGDDYKGKAWLIAGVGFLMLPPVGIFSGFFVRGEDVCIDSIPIVKVMTTVEIKVKK